MSISPIFKPKILVIVGPTASGKSDLAVSLAQQHNGEVISADSRQVYKGLDIGTGKITKKEMKGVVHHMLDVADPKRVYTVSQFHKGAKKKISEIIKKGKLPIICGGTGFYIDTLVEDRTLPKVPPNPSLRKKFSKKSTAELFTILQKLDKNFAEKIDRKNPHRLIRAIEIAEALGSVPPLQKESAYDTLWIGIAPDNDTLQQRIHTRLLKRLRQGMVHEAETLKKQGLSYKRMETLGLEYGFLSRLLQKQISKEQCVRDLSKAIEQYAKRQKTWFKRNKDIHWFSTGTDTHIVPLAEQFLKD